MRGMGGGQSQPHRGWLKKTVKCARVSWGNRKGVRPPIWNVTSLPFVGTFYSFIHGFSCFFEILIL